MNPVDIHVWRIELDTIAEVSLPPPSPDETERATRFAHPELQRRYLASHRALRAILNGVTGGAPRIEIAANGKPFLPDMPEWKFNLSHSRGLALAAVARDVEVGVDVEYLRTERDWEAIVERFFPPSAAAEFLAAAEGDREPQFFRLWTRLEAMWKALGVGLHGASQEMDGPWTIADLDLGPGIAGAVAAPAAGLRVVMRSFGENE